MIESSSFADRPSRLRQGIAIAKREWSFIAWVLLGVTVVLTALVFFVVAQAREKEDAAKQVTDEKIRAVVQEMILPLAQRQDSLIRVVGLLAQDYGDFFERMTPSSKPLRFDTAGIYEQKAPEEKK